MFMVVLTGLFIYLIYLFIYLLKKGQPDKNNATFSLPS